jgi:hypothetical protein
VKIIFLKNQVSSLKCWEEPELMLLTKRERERENHPTLVYTLLPQVPSRLQKGRTSQDHFNFPTPSAWNISQSQKEIQFLE